MLSFGGAAQALASSSSQKTPLTLAFEAVQGSRTDAVVVPEGYVAQVLVPWGTPLNQNVTWQPEQPMTAERQAESVGMHHDGMAGFALDTDNASRRFVLALNNEYIDQAALWAPQGGPTNADEASGQQLSRALRSTLTVSPLLRSKRTPAANGRMCRVRVITVASPVRR